MSSSAALGTTPGANGSQTIATVERAADVLVLFSRSTERTLGVTEIASELGLSKAAVHRILASLRTRELVQLDETTRRYALGPAALALGVAYQAGIDVRSSAVPELHALSRATDETATLSVMSGSGRIYVDQVTPTREIVMSVPLGLAFPLHAGASSKALLAFLPDAEIDQALVGDLDSTTLRAELATIREHGYATSAGERQPGAASVAAPVFDHTGRPTAAISVCGPAERFSTHLRDASRLLLEATDRVSARLGHRPTGRPS